MIKFIALFFIFTVSSAQADGLFDWWQTPQWVAKQIHGDAYTAVLEYRHTHRAVHAPYGFNQASPTALIAADIIRGMIEGTEKRPAQVILGSQFYNLAHGEQEAVLLSYSGGTHVILSDWGTRKPVGVFSPLGGVQLY